METTATSRFWGTSGAVFHWLYFTPLRSHSTLWYQLIVWASYGGGPSEFLATVQPFEHRLVALGSGETHRFDRDELLAAATAAMPDAEVVAVHELTEYDAYYGDRRHRRAPLPVLRLRFDDAERTWLYLDPALGRIVHREQRRSRVAAGCTAVCTGSTSRASTTGGRCGTSSWSSCCWAACSPRPLLSPQRQNASGAMGHA